MKDLAAEIRNAVNYLDACGDGQVLRGDVRPILTEAADEIERLRKVAKEAYYEGMRRKELLRSG